MAQLSQIKLVYSKSRALMMLSLNVGEVVTGTRMTDLLNAGVPTDYTHCMVYNVLEFSV